MRGTQKLVAIAILSGVTLRGAAPFVALPDLPIELSLPVTKVAIPPERPLPNWASKWPVPVHLPWVCGCGGFGGFRYGLSVALPPDPLPLLNEAYRKAELGEVWLLDPSVDILANAAGTWDGYSYRGMAITHVRKCIDGTPLAELFRICAVLLSDELDEEYLDSLLEPVATVDSAIMELAFSPDFVVSFAGSSITRIEVQLKTRRVLICGTDGSGFYVLTPAAEGEVRRIIAEMKSAPNQEPQPTRRLFTDRADAHSATKDPRS